MPAEAMRSRPVCPKAEALLDLLVYGDGRQRLADDDFAELLHGLG